MIGRLNKQFGTPEFLITDHGGQFQKTFKQKVNKLGIRHVRGRVRCPAVNGKIERFFRTFKMWWTTLLKRSDPRALQRCLNEYRDWYNQVRPHASLDGRTPDEVWHGIEPPEPIPILQVDPIDVTASVTRRPFRGYQGDPQLRVVEIDIQVTPRRAA
jgi:hypothetical protein